MVERKPLEVRKLEKFGLDGAVTILYKYIEGSETDIDKVKMAFEEFKNDPDSVKKHGDLFLNAESKLKNEPVNEKIVPDEIIGATLED